MTHKLVKDLIPLVFAAIVLVVILWWMDYNPVVDLTRNIPGMDNSPKISSRISDVIDIGGIIAQGDGKPSTIEGVWPRFRGSQSNNISKEKNKLLNNLGKDPKILWSVKLGEGHAGPVVHKGRVFLLDYDERQKADILRCLSLDDGREIWSIGYRIFIKRNHGISRTVPAVSENYVVTIGPKCHVMCVDRESGELKWGINLEKDHGTEVPLWYTGQCPIIENNIAIIAPGGKSLMMGVDCESGEIIWNTPNSNNWRMSHSSIMPIDYQGERIYLYCSIDGMVGISGNHATAGRILFASTLWTHKVIAPSPVYLGDGKIFVTAGYGKGSGILKINKKDGIYKLNLEQKIKPVEGIASEQQTPIFYNGHLFSILPKDAGARRNQLICVHPDNLKKIIWSSEKEKRFGLGPYLIADGKLFVLSDDGTLSILKASSRKFLPIGETKILQGVDAWAPMALVNGRLLARDSKTLVCIDLKEAQN